MVSMQQTKQMRSAGVKLPVGMFALLFCFSGCACPMCGSFGINRSSIDSRFRHTGFRASAKCASHTNVRNMAPRVQRLAQARSLHALLATPTSHEISYTLSIRVGHQGPSSPGRRSTRSIAHSTSPPHFPGHDPAAGSRYEQGAQFSSCCSGLLATYPHLSTTAHYQCRPSWASFSEEAQVAVCTL